MTVLTFDQRTPAWHSARLGKLTGSRARAGLFGNAGRQTLRTQLVRERLTGRSQESSYCSAHMQRAMRLEPEACAAYEAETGYLVRHVGFVAHDSLEAGYSPDGLVGDDGLLEVKCPTAEIHFDYTVPKLPLPAAYRTQVTHGLWLTGRAWVDVVSYHPDFGPALQVTVRRFHAAELDLVGHEHTVRTFLAEVDAELAAVPRRLAR